MKATLWGALLACVLTVSCTNRSLKTTLQTGEGTLPGKNPPTDTQVSSQIAALLADLKSLIQKGLTNSDAVIAAISKLAANVGIMGTTFSMSPPISPTNLNRCEPIALRRSGGSGAEMRVTFESYSNDIDSFILSSKSDCSNDVLFSELVFPKNQYHLLAYYKILKPGLVIPLVGSLHIPKDDGEIVLTSAVDLASKSLLIDSNELYINALFKQLTNSLPSADDMRVNLQVIADNATDGTSGREPVALGILRSLKFREMRARSLGVKLLLRRQNDTDNLVPYWAGHDFSGTEVKGWEEGVSMEYLASYEFKELVSMLSRFSRAEGGATLAESRKRRLLYAIGVLAEGYPENGSTDYLHELCRKFCDGLPDRIVMSTNPNDFAPNVSDHITYKKTVLKFLREKEGRSANIRNWYLQYLSRVPSEAEVELWSPGYILNPDPLEWEVLQARFLGSPEFLNLVKTGIK